MRTGFRGLAIGLVLVTAAAAGCSSTTAGGSGAVQNAAPISASSGTGSGGVGGVCPEGFVDAGGDVCERTLPFTYTSLPYTYTQVFVKTNSHVEYSGSPNGGTYYAQDKWNPSDGSSAGYYKVVDDGYYVTRQDPCPAGSTDDGSSCQQLDPAPAGYVDDGTEWVQTTAKIPDPSPTATPTPSESSTPTGSPSSTPSSADCPSSSPSDSGSASPTGSPSASPSGSDCPSSSPTPTPTVASRSGSGDDICDEGLDYACGDAGPGTGTVFYASTVPFACGADMASSCNFLEVAPNGWNGKKVKCPGQVGKSSCGGSPSETSDWGSEGAGAGKGYPYCLVNAGSKTVTASVGTAIGSGYANSVAMTTACASTAAGQARNYDGGDMTDWSLPSIDELNALYSYPKRDVIGGFAADVYWSSSQSGVNNGYNNVFVHNFGMDVTWEVSTYTYREAGVRPVRAFASSDTPLVPTDFGAKLHMCKSGLAYACGDAGPGSGTVFYASTIPFACGADMASSCNFLEVAPNGWNGKLVNCPGQGTGLVQSSCGGSPDKTSDWGSAGIGTGRGFKWCTGKDVAGRNGKAVPTGTVIGSGFANTSVLVPLCKSGDAVVLARGYRGGQMTDWSLASKDELTALFYYRGRDAIGGFGAAGYWSSSQYNVGTAWAQDFKEGKQWYPSLGAGEGVRPVRAF